MQDLQDFLTPVSFFDINEDEGYAEGQIGHRILTQHDQDFDLDNAELVIVGVKETRGNGLAEKQNNGADVIRRELYKLNYWHTEVIIADAGNIEVGATINDSYAAIKTVLDELYRRNKTVIIIGGSADVTLAQYNAYRNNNETIEATCIDAAINLKGETSAPAENFLMEMFTGEPNILNHYNHIAFQSYFVHPRMLETLDKLRFDFYRLGTVQADLEEMERVLRNTNMLSLNMSAVKHSDAPANKNCPNGLSGVDACTLTRFAGMSTKLNSIGIYGYRPADDIHDITAKQAAQMLWYFIDGRHRLKQESSLEERDNFNEFHVVFSDMDTTFLQSKRTNRWWMQMPDGKFIACSHNDYLTAGKNDFPERWLRVMERS